MDYSNIYQSLQDLCTAAGTNITQICRDADVNRSILQSWKNENPKTLQILARLLAAIDAKKGEKEIIKIPQGAKLTRKGPGR